MSFVVFFDVVGEGFEVLVFDLVDFVIVCFDYVFVVFYKVFDLLWGNVLVGKEYMFVKCYCILFFLCFD